MDHVETEGDTIDKAIDNALRLLGVEREKITVDILSEGKKGILGFGSQKARIATLRKSAIDLRLPSGARPDGGAAAGSGRSGGNGAEGERGTGRDIELDGDQRESN